MWSVSQIDLRLKKRRSRRKRSFGVSAKPKTLLRPHWDNSHIRERFAWRKWAKTASLWAAMKW
jgi:hypothetical protein